MCGILLTFNCVVTSDLIKRRGPDYYNRITDGKLTRISSVLALRGHQEQPYHGLQFNGEIYINVPSDTVYLYSVFMNNPIEDALTKVDGLDGEFAFTFVSGSKIYFGRDCFGRRSLMYKMVNDALIVSSLYIQDDMVECDCDKWYVFDMDTFELDFINKTVEIPPFIYKLVDSDLLVPMPEYIIKYSSYLEELEQCFIKSVEDRLFTSETNSYAVLFSGGLDCSLLVYYLDKLIPKEYSIDLLNVAFEHRNSKVKYVVPDRQTAIERCEELKKLCPIRKFNLVLVNVPLVDYLKEKHHIINLIRPQNTVMDLSICSAFWFAAKGTGLVNEAEYTSKSKILFSGLGADELFGGYSRHRSAFEHSSWSGLFDCLNVDVQRLNKRNLGRDDRVIADLGKEIRYPFLHPSMVQFANQCPINIKCDPRYPQGEGDKRILRALANKIGLRGASTAPKRAIQFGSKTAKLESSKEKGTDLL